MSTIVPMYGFGGGGGTGATLTVNAPPGCTVTVSKDGKTKTKTAGADGVAVFRGLATGQWTVTITDGEQTAQKTVTITADYSTAITFFSATINVSYPAGYTCAATYGDRTFTAPDTNGTWAITVNEPGTWSFSLDGGTAETVTITTNGEEQTLNKWHLYNNGVDNTALTGGLTTSGYKGASNKWSFNDTNISVSTGNDVGDVFGTANKIHMANVKNGYVRMSSTQNKWGEYFGVSKSKSADSFIANTKISGTGNITAAFDAIDVTADVYVLFSATANSKLKIYEIWLEC